jgi:hypothetical protein
MFPLRLIMHGLTLMRPNILNGDGLFHPFTHVPFGQHIQVRPNRTGGHPRAACPGRHGKDIVKGAPIGAAAPRAAAARAT